MSLKLRVVMVGAGTNVGKTHVACALAVELVRRGLPLVARKPVESGYVEPASDAAALARAAGHPILRPFRALDEPVSPHRAARRAGVTLELSDLLAWCGDEPCSLIETAGGLLSPLGPSLTNLELTVALAPTAVVLVVANRLGTLHEVRACQLALAAHGLVPHVVLSGAPLADEASTHNAEELVTLGWASRVVEFPRAALDAEATRRAATRLADAIAP
ncbi:MAG: dethiobiotin synthase [Deltaproteobacteria bacterium]|nr:dethiobiotin synthase [Deltaproteobacteria bacterium]